jgi:DNA modification methylase
MVDIKLYNDDCLNIMSELPEHSVDMILCDLPYGRTQNRWDNVIPFDKLWDCYNRISKDNTAILLFSDGLFMADLMISNKKMWKYNIVWNKVLVSGFLNAHRMPLRITEEICVFYNKQPTYNPQMTKGKPNHSVGDVNKKLQNNNYGKYTLKETNFDGEKYPVSIVEFMKPHPSKAVHPTQKPVELLEYLIKTYTNENDIVLDNCMGSGSTGIACRNLNRNFIGIELDKKYFDVATERINKAEKINNRPFHKYTKIT